MSHLQTNRSATYIQRLMEAQDVSDISISLHFNDRHVMRTGSLRVRTLRSTSVITNKHLSERHAS